MTLDLLGIFNIFIFVEALWLIIPAYAANGLVPLFRKICKHPIDGGRTWNGKRILGDGKSWEGFGVGVVVAIVIALIMQFAFPYLPWNLSAVTLDIVPMGIAMGFVLGFGTMLGDSLGSFLKRRLGFERGKPTFLLDQEVFVILALAFAGTVAVIKMEWIILLLIITPILHWLANLVGWILHVTRRPF